MAAQGFFMLSGYGLNVFLARYFAPEIYGIYGVAMAVLVWVELFVINGVPTAMQKFLSESSSAAAAFFRLGRRMQLGYVLAVFILFIAAVPLISAWLHDPNFKKLLWIAAPDIVLYGLYWFYLGVHSGLHRFEWQALIVVGYGISKVGFSIGLVLAGAGIAGAVVGNFLGSAFGLLLGSWLLKTVPLSFATAPETEHFSRLTKFATPIVLYTLSINAMLYVDLLFVQSYLSPSAAGYYTAAATVARAPYFIFLALGYTVLPVLSRMLAQENFNESRRLLRQTSRLLFILLLPMLVLVMANASEIIELLYAEAYAPAASILRTLIVGIAIYTLLMVLTTIMSADGYPHRAFLISLLCAVTDVILCFILVPKLGTTGAALATVIASTLGVLIAGAHVLFRFGAILPAGTLMRVIVAGAATLAFSILCPATAGWMLLLKLTLLFGFYLFILYLLGERSGAEKALS
jgi:O-antigen/teichoic acid export membrane protein